MTQYAQSLSVASALTLLLTVIFLDLFSPIVGLNLSLLEWLVLAFTANLVTLSLGHAFGVGQTRATLVETEQYAVKVSKPRG